MTAPTRPGTRLVRLLRRTAVVLLTPPTAYLVMAVAGLLPANTEFRMPSENGVTIYVVHNGVHTDLVLPTNDADVDWRTWFPVEHFESPAPYGDFIQFGWGDRVFYVGTPTWAELKLLPTLRAALWPTDTAMHVQFVDRPGASPRSRRIVVSREEYSRLVGLLRESFQQDADGRPIQLENPGYNAWDAFYAARGSYHLFHTCNCWSGRLLRRTGIRVGIWTPFPQSVMWSLPSEAAEPAPGT